VFLSPHPPFSYSFSPRSITTFDIADTLQGMAFVSYTVRETEIYSYTRFYYFIFLSSSLLLSSTGFEFGFRSGADVHYNLLKTPFHGATAALLYSILFVKFLMYVLLLFVYGHVSGVIVQRKNLKLLK
jgi:hypothetical protein